MMIMVGGMFQFTAVAMTADGMVVDDVEFTWMSDDPEVATVDGSGMVTAVAAGTAMITATGNDVTSMPATVTVAESAPMVDSVEIVDAMPAMLEIGGTLQLMAVARTADGTMIGGATISWSSDDIGVATVDTTGLVTAVGAGMADITAMTEETTSDPVTVTVAEPPEVVRVAVEPMTATIEEGEMQQFTATAFDADDMEITGKTFTWSSSNTTVATINSSSGLASAMEAGSTTITAMVDGKSGTAMLTVTEPPPPPPPVVDRVTVSPSSPSIEEGETQQFSAMAFESDSTVISGKTFTWTSSDTSKATISSSGLATGKSAGSTTIRASVDGKSGMATLTVTAPTPPPPPPPMLRSRTATISGSYSAAGSVTLSEGAGGQLKLTITGFRSTAPDTWLALSEKASIDWAVGETLPSTARSFGEVTGMTSFTSTFTPPSGKDIDSYDYIILYCRQFDLRISSNAFSN
ncbi:MAG: DM13 domain-containing protein [Gemmatimonadetes bacterium]|nr:DM13 domain-containing protein [Gemmatimonadota bacterium]